MRASALALSSEIFQSTPPRGGRQPGRGRYGVLEDFNPRPREGGDGQPWPNDDDDISIHAPARGATGRCSRLFALENNFNPRPREGGDYGVAIGDKNKALFQSTPPRGGRLDKADAWLLVDDFNPRPREGGDNRGYIAEVLHCDFNPRPREGGDILIGVYL